MSDEYLTALHAERGLLEVELGALRDPEDSASVGEAFAALLGVPLDKNLERFLVHEFQHAAEVMDSFYVPLHGLSEQPLSDREKLAISVGLLQGVTLARAAEKLRGRAPG